MKIRPLQDRILVKRVEEEEKTAGASSSPTPPRKSRKRAKSSPSAPARSSRRQDLRPNVKKGDRVLFGKYSGNEVKVDGIEHLIIREDDVLAVLE